MKFLSSLNCYFKWNTFNFDFEIKKYFHLINFNIKKMRKQTGIIYCKDLTNSNSKTIDYLELPEEQRTVRKSSAVFSASISVKNSQCSDSRQSKVSKGSGKLASNSNPTSWKNDFSSETSRQFSSIHESSMLSHESSHSCID